MSNCTGCKAWKTCKNCRWWGVVRDGACNFVDTTHADHQTKGFTIEVEVDDDQGLQAFVMTGPELSCLHFEALPGFIPPTEYPDWDPDDFPLPDWALRRSDGNYMEIGAQLATRDGRLRGNAVVIGEGTSEGKQTAGIRTDAGNMCVMTEEDLEAVYYPPAYVMDLSVYDPEKFLLGSFGGGRIDE